MPTDGMKKDNRQQRRVEPLLTVPQLKTRYLHGLETTDNNGNPIEDPVYEAAIDIAVSMLEHDLDIAIVARDEEEQKDYYGNDYTDWGFLQCNNLPVQSITSVKVIYLRDVNGIPQNVLDIPKSWIRLREHDGVIRLVPNNAVPAGLQVDASGSFFPEIFRRYSNVPQLWELKYVAGFPDGKVPMLVNAVIGMLAAILIMNDAADLLLGAGIASTSLSIDGLSQSINSTASAENTTFSARIKEYSRLLWGETINGKNQGYITVLRRYYQGQTLNII